MPRICLVRTTGKLIEYQSDATELKIIFTKDKSQSLRDFNFCFQNIPQWFSQPWFPV